MRGFAYVVALAALVGCGGGSSAPDADPLGMDCSMGQNCGPHMCVEGVCTTACASSDDCRGGTECRSVDGNLACVERRWANGPGEYETDCFLEECADGFTCVERIESDPYAYCTDSCDDDRDCPPNYFCSGNCVRKTACSPCTLDEECITDEVPDGKCADDGSGQMRCSKACDPKGESCLPSFECVGSGNDAHCVHMSGSCSGDGATCAPCQTDDDCGDTAGAWCHREYFSGETYCIAPCQAGNTCDAPFFCANITGEGVGCIPPSEHNYSCETYWSTM